MDTPRTAPAKTNGSRDAIIRVRDITVGFNNKLVLDHLDLDVYRGEILGFVGGSGAGKSVLTRTIIGLLPRREGTIEVFGTDMLNISDEEMAARRQAWVQPKPRYTRGVLAKFGKLASTASRGAVTDAFED